MKVKKQSGRAVPALFPSRRDAAAALIWPVLRVLSIFAANQSKCLSMNHLHAAMSFPGKAQSSPIKPNQVILAMSMQPSRNIRRQGGGKPPHSRASSGQPLQNARRRESCLRRAVYEAAWGGSCGSKLRRNLPLDSFPAVWQHRASMRVSEKPILPHSRSVQGGAGRQEGNSCSVISFV